MLYHIDTEERSSSGHHVTVYTLSHPTTRSLIEVWPSHGFNCIKWQVGGQDLLFTAPDWHDHPLPTRSGIPILFPFPNRIRNGQFTFGNEDFQLAKNDSTHLNAIHGFSPRIPWRVAGYAADQHQAWIHGDFQLSLDATEAAGNWPGDARLSVIYRFTGSGLRMEMTVQNMGDTPFPFGLGLHPYFRIPGATGDCSRYRLHAPARTLWELEASLPTGQRPALPDDLNWNRPRMIGATQLDTLYGDLGVLEQDAKGLLLRAMLEHEDVPGTLQVWTSADFRESVLFTPPHRQAVCIEPYTCPTDAINLQQQGHDTGWRELGFGESWSGIVEMRWVA